MKFQIKSRWTGAAQFECELDAKFETENYSVQLGAAVKLAFKSGASLIGASLDGAPLDGASLIGASLIGASLIGASLIGASLIGARLDGASLIGARLDGASLDGASLDGARLDGASLDGARLDGARLIGASLIGASLIGASLIGASLDGASLDGARLVGARLDGASGEKLTLKGPRPIIWFGPIGRDKRTVYAFLTDNGVYVRAGCFWDTINKFREQVYATHNENEHAQEYAAFLALATAHFALWPVEAK